MKRAFRLIVAAAVVASFTPIGTAQAEGFLNYYTTPFEYCANACTMPSCCIT